MTRERLELAFYQFFSETRMFSGKEFFHPVDSHGRDMIPVYEALLKILSSSDLQAIRRFYLLHGTTGLAARQWVESKHALLSGNTLEVTSAEAEALNSVHILSAETAAQLSRANLNKPLTPAPVGFQGWDSGDESDNEPTEARHNTEIETAEESDTEDEEKDDDDANIARTLSYAPSDTGVTKLLAPPSSPNEKGKNKNHVSLYAAYSARAELVKVGMTTTLGYEECAAKYKKIYGHLDEFFFFSVENGMFSICCVVLFDLFSTLVMLHRCI